MSSSTASLTSVPLARGTYAPSTATDVRSPCPLVNSLANHGYIPRDGRGVRASELTAAMNQVGLSAALGATFANPIFLEQKPNAHQPQVAAQTPPLRRSFLARVWHTFRNPWSLLFAAFGVRKLGQSDSAGRHVLDLDQLALPGVIEHDISLTRLDIAQGDNLTPQPDLVNDLLECSSDGGLTLSVDDLVKLRRRRITRQREVNPGMNYGTLQNQIGCTEIALILHVFGDGKKMRCDYARALFQEERLPTSEGWRKRRWWTLGFVELGSAVGAIKKMLGPAVEE